MLFTTIIPIAVALATFASSASASPSVLQDLDRRAFREGFLYGRQAGHLARRDCGIVIGFGKKTGKMTDPECTQKYIGEKCSTCCSFMGSGMRGGGGAQAGCLLACDRLARKFKN